VEATLDKLQLIILSMVQGLTEFLPISSSAHLILVPQVFHWPDQGLVFDVAVHFGSLIAVVYYFRDEVWRMLKSWLRSIAGGESDQDSLLAWWVIIGTLPAVIFGFLLQEPIEEKLRDPWVLGISAGAEGCAAHRLVPGAGPDTRDFAFRDNDYAWTVPRVDSPGFGAVFFPAGNAGCFRQRRLRDRAHVHRGQSDCLGRPAARRVAVGD
jgi:hypothetical protein